MTIQRARLFILITSLVMASSHLMAQAPPPGALNPALGPSQLPPPSPYYGMPAPASQMQTQAPSIGYGMAGMPPGGMPGYGTPAGYGMPGGPNAPMGAIPAGYAGMQPGMAPGMQPGMAPPQMGMGPGMQPGMPPQMGMGPMPPGMAPGMGGPNPQYAMQLGAQAGAMATPYGNAQVSGCADCPPLPGHDGSYVCDGCNGGGCQACGGSGRRADRGFDMFAKLGNMLKPYGAGGWCAPRYYDAYVDFIYMTREEGTRGGPLVSDGPAGLFPPVVALSSDDGSLDSAAGVRAAVAVHVGAYSAIEFAWIGALNWAGQAQVADPNDELFHVFSNFGTNPPPVAGLFRGGFSDTDSAELATLEYSSSFDSIELDYRKRWVAPNCRFHGSWLAGIRYAKLDEEFIHTMTVNHPDFFGLGRPDTVGFLDAFTGTSNSMTGAQVGGDLWITLLPGFRFGGEFKGAVMGNRASQRTVIDAGSLAAPLIEEANSDQISFLVELGINSIWRVNENWTIRKGYQMMFIDGVALGPENFNTTEPFTAARVPLLVDDGSIFMHGFTAGLEYMW